jgi:hypothetical protein
VSPAGRWCAGAPDDPVPAGCNLTAALGTDAAINAHMSVGHLEFHLHTILDSAAPGGGFSWIPFAVHPSGRNAHLKVQEDNTVLAKEQ